VGFQRYSRAKNSVTSEQGTLKLDGTLWVPRTHHIIFSLGFALQRLGFKLINQIAWQKPDPVPNALHSAFTH
jgi:site-specific DNA-methyltransferase (adenine-specific)